MLKMVVDSRQLRLCESGCICDVRRYYHVCAFSMRGVLSGMKDLKSYFIFELLFAHIHVHSVRGC